VRDPGGVETGAISSLVRLDGKRVLDVGCGDGRMTRFAADRAAYVYAFDPDEDEVAKARSSLTRAQARRVDLAVHDIAALDVRRERFDVALCGWSL
jgi:2-polyprenyl-3-methyl-5-hydroxy-6-metoxy-1,4-benzoquinol methylase